MARFSAWPDGLRRDSSPTSFEIRKPIRRPSSSFPKATSHPAMNPSSNAQSPLSASPHPAPARARIIAIGGAGAEMALAVRQTGTADFTFAAIDGDWAAVQSLPFEEKLFVGARLTRGFGAGGDPELAKAAAEDELPAIRALCQDQAMVFILAGLGGGSGTGIAPVVARVAREAGASVFAFVTAPFECEGTRRQQQAAIGLHRLKTVADGVLCLPNEKMLIGESEGATLPDSFGASRIHLRDAVLCIWEQLTRPGLLNVSFSDLCSVLRGPNLESAFARVEVEGPDRAELALQQLLAHPLLSKGEILSRAEALLVCFRAGDNLGMAETRRMIRELTRLSGGARVVVGASVNPACGARLTVTVIVSTRQLVLHEVVQGPVRDGLDRGGLDRGSLGRGEGETELGLAQTGRHLTPPPPELTSEMAGELLGRKAGVGRGGRVGRGKPQQVQLPFEVITKGRFERCEPTVRAGNNLDQPTYLRRGITLN